MKNIMEKMKSAGHSSRMTWNALNVGIHIKAILHYTNVAFANHAFFTRRQETKGSQNLHMMIHYIRRYNLKNIVEGTTETAYVHKYITLRQITMIGENFYK